MFPMNRALGGVLLLSALLTGPIARAAADKAVHLLVTPKVGRVTHATGVLKMNMKGTSIVMNASQRETVKAVQANGDVLVETADEGTTVNAGGAVQKQPLSAPYTTLRDKFGKAKDDKKDAGDPSLFTPEVTKLMDRLTDVILTDKPVRAHDSWQNILENPVVKAKKITVKDTYLGLETIGGRGYWKIKQTAEAIVDTAGARVTYTLTEWINPTDGETFKLDGDIRGVPTQVGPMNIRISSQTIRKGKRSF